jgi:hypothetical protein
LVVPSEDEQQLLEASIFMDNNECNTVIAAARGSAGLSMQETVQRINAAGQAFGQAAKQKFNNEGEW